MISSILVQFGALVNCCAMIGPMGIGTEARVWEHVAVVYAEVLDAKQQDDSPSKWKLRLRPLATLTGHFDAAENDDLEAMALMRNFAVSHIVNVPVKGTKVIALLGGVGVANDDLYSIPPGDAVITPVNENGDRPCLFEVTGFDDPKVTETIENLRKLRGQQCEEAEKAAASEKKK